MSPVKVSLETGFASFSERWRPKVAAELNGQELKLVKIQGTFPWHSHADAEELFLVHRGRMRVEFETQVVELGPGELVVVPRGVVHGTAAEEGAEILIFEPAATRNTGDIEDPVFTAPNGVRI